LPIAEAVTHLFLVGLLVLGLVVPRWWTTGAAMGITILLWVYDATQVHPQLESSLNVWVWFVAGAAAGAAAGTGVLVRRLGRSRS
jgi:hypothetical protein